MNEIYKIDDINTLLVLRTIWINQSIKLDDLLRIYSFKESIMDQIIINLCTTGIVQKEKKGPLNEEILSINKDYGYVTGLGLRPDSYTAVGVNLSGDILFSKEEKMIINGDNFNSAFFDIISRVEEEAGELSTMNIGIGVGVSGIVNPDDGIIIRSIPLQITKPFNFQNDISQQIFVPIFLDNDANCCSWGELAFHKSTGLEDFLFLLTEFNNKEKSLASLGPVAIGLGIVLNGKVYYGHNYSAGEFRSINWKPGNNSQFSLSDEELFNIRTDKNLFNRFAEELSANIAILVNTFNISNIFIGGSIEKYSEVFTQILKKTISSNNPYAELDNCIITPSSLGKKSVAYGAAGMILEHIFRHPKIPKRDIRNLITNQD
jgi:predicted NBD/HSP70 family sugar kinase